MLIAIASDLHDNLANWQIFNNYLHEQGISTLLFCGDLCNSETLQHIRQEFAGKIYFIAGNQELYNLQEAENLKNSKFLGHYGSIEIDHIKIGLIHEPLYKDQLLKENKQLDYIFYGHTHKPWIENEGSLVIANPGTLGGVFYQSSFALLNTENKKLELKILNQL